MKNHTKTRIKKIFHILFLFILALLIVGTFYIKFWFNNQSIDELLFYLVNGAIKGDLGVYTDAIKVCTPFIIILLFIFIASFYNISKKEEIKIKNKKIYPFNKIINHRTKSTIILLIISLLISAYNVDLFKYTINMIKTSNFIEDNYIASENKVTFANKRNLIYIYVESLETTLFSKEHNGEWDYEVMPELYELLYDDDSTFFSANNSTGGMSEIEGVTWTTAGMITTSTGLPFKVPVFNNKFDKTNIMSGTYAIGDILKENGYYNELITSALSSFGGVSDFYTLHGNYEIVDDESLSKYGFKRTEKDSNPWGFNDNYLFKIAKERLQTISKKEQPFNLTIMTIDTHPTDGYVGNYTLNKFDKQYENVYATESKLLYDFINWIKEQDFYENTTIVVVGDHLSVQYNLFKNIDYNKRNIYNVIINSEIESQNNRNRIFTSADMYPTTIAAIGGKIEGEQLGLGINLYSTKETLAEKYGLKKMNKELEKRSTYYDENLLRKKK